ncbi:GNAT family N-acetyltransferase [Candidatus Scalindua japonica]|uniref:GNAT family N-acetyltransferase n=1 Tax=Candidatus Scalindua japonica TaxID=1284222 RepID=UPI000BDF89D3|nr:GNAT family N-acetyltransferase [Candidatus Scalindua japonica]
MNIAGPIEIHIGLPEEYIREAAEIFFDSFQQKFFPIMNTRENGISFLQKHLNPKGTMVAISGRQLLGIAGLQYEGCHFFSPSLSGLAHEFGWLRGILKIIRMRLFNSRDREGELYLKAIMVSSSIRSKGVGTHLLTGVSDFAWAHDFSTIRLDVVDTNPDARRFYERNGFIATKVRRCPLPFLFLCRAMGFSSAITMIKKIS